MINWDMVDSLLRRTRPNQEGPYRVAIYSRMRYPEGQEDIARQHIKFMKIIMDRDQRFRIVDVYSEFGVPSSELTQMLEYQRLIADCKAGRIDMIYIHDISRLARNCLHMMVNAEPLAQCNPEVGILFFKDELFVMASDAEKWAEKMASGDYSACRLPYFVGLIPPAPDHSEI